MTNSTLMKAILSMDAYNRGYNAGIKFGTLSGNNSIEDTGTQIGTATIFSNSGTFVDGNNQRIDDDISFYALSYNYNGAKIIAYRGTDNLAGDAATGYGVGAGNPKESQAQMAFDFYRTIAGTGVDPRTANISLTGHSLGGGLAGLVGSVYGKSGTLFDNMAFEGAAQNTKLFSDPSSGSLYNTAFKQKVYGDLTPWNPMISSNLQTYHVNGEFLTANRSQQKTPQYGLDIGPGVNLPGVDSGLFGDNLHSIATLAILLYADPLTGMGIPTDWKSATRYFWPVLYDDAFAAKIGNASSVAGTLHDDGKYSAIVRTALAYSAIDEGTRIYGDTGIKALYNDANDLGVVLQKTGLPSALQTSQILTDISKAFVQFSGMLALNKVMNGAAAAPALNGVLSVADTANDHTLTVSFADSLWKIANAGSLPESIAARDALVKDLLTSASPSVRNTMKALWGGEANGTDPNAIFERIAFSTAATGNSIIANGSANKAAIFVGGTGAETITGSNGHDLILGNGGGDRIHGGAGNDIFMGGAGVDYFYGDAGSDTANYSNAPAGSRILATVSATSAVVTDGYGTTDYLTDVENITLGSNNDTLSLSAPPSGDKAYYYDGGNGVDTANLGIGSGLIVDKGQSTTGQPPVIWNATGTSKIVLTNFESIASSASNATILPDLTDPMGAMGGNGYPELIYDYSASEFAAVMDVRNFFAFEGTVMVGGVTQFVGVTDELHGTNMGDTITTGVSYDTTFTLYTGSGSDVIRNLDSGGNFESGRTGLSIVYRGGNDVIDNGYTLREIRMWEGITAEDLVFDLSGDYDITGYTNLVIGIRNAGILTINNLGVAGVNPWHHAIVLDSGGFYDFGPTGLVYNPGPGRTAINGTWGADSIIGHGTAETFYGLGGDDRIDGQDGNDTINGGGGNDILIGGNGNDVLKGSFDDDTLIGGAGNNTLDGGDGYDIANYSGMGSGITITMSNGSGTVVRGAETDTLVSIEKIIGTSYNDAENGGTGDDGFALSGGKDTITETGGADTIILASGASLETLTLSVSGTNLKIVQTAGVNETTLTGQLGADTAKMIERLQYADGFWLPLDRYGTWIKGTAAVETINGDSGGAVKDDVITAGTGSDTVNGLAGDDVLSGDAGNDTLRGGTGNDRVEGGSGNDTIYGDSGSDDLYGGTGNDTFVVAPGDGTDTIYEMTGEGTDTLKITGGVLPANVQMWGDATGTYLKYTDSDIVYIPGLAYAAIERIVFDNGTMWTQATAFNMTDTDESHSLSGGALADIIDGKGGDDSIYGLNGNDTLTGGTGSDLLAGGKGNDTYVFRTGDSLIAAADRLLEIAGEGIDTIKLTGGILPANVQRSIDTNGAVTIKYSATDQITFGSSFDSVNGYTPLIEKIAFDNGTVVDLRNGFSIADTAGQNTTIRGTVGVDAIDAKDGNDIVYGYAGNDTITGGTGRDQLYGGQGNDTYILKAGDSALPNTTDYITENANEGIDTLKLTGGILPANVAFWTNDYSGFTIQYSTNDQVFVPYTRDPLTNAVIADTVEKIVFDNGTVWDLRNSLPIMDTADTHSLYGSNQNDVIDARGGDDYINGFAGNDTITGGIGNDQIYGGLGNDTFIFKAGDSSTAIEYVSENVGEGVDTIKLTGGILPGNVTIWSDAYNYLHVQYTANDQIAFLGTNDGVTGISSTIEKIAFDNGTVWDLRNGVTLAGDNTSQGMHGTGGNDTLNLLGGDDYLYAYAGNDTLNGGTGTDYLYGGQGDDVYVFKAGDSSSATPDYIGESTGEGVDTIKLTGGILPANVTLSASGYTLTLQYSATDVITIQSDYDSNGNGLNPNVEKVVFDNGTVWDFRNGITTSDGSAGNEVHGTMLKDIINGNGGNDTLYGEGNNDILNGGAGNDMLYGGYGGDQYIYAAGGGQGNDIIRDDSGVDDSITLGTGYTAANVSLTRVGQYDMAVMSGGQRLFLIQGQFDGSGSIETLKYGDGTTLNLLTYSHTVNGTAGNDYLYGVSYGAGGDKLNGLDGNDTIFGDDGNDILSGNAGDDIVNGGMGDDTVIYESGVDIFSDYGGTDIISIASAAITAANMTLARPAGNSSDLEIIFNGVHAFNIQGQFNQGQDFEAIKFSNGTTFNLSAVQYTANGTAGDDYLYGISSGGNPNDILKGNAGNDYISAYGGNDAITGGTGNDWTDGGEGDDTYVYNSGDGFDTISDSSGNDLIQVGAGFVKADLTWARDAGTNNMILSLKGVQAMTLQNQFTTGYQIETVKFSNGTTQSLAGLQIATNGTTGDDYLPGLQANASQDDNIKGLAGNDTIYGYEGNDILAGGTGNDYIDGGYGNDTFSYNAGDGVDTLADGAGNDVIQVGAGYTKTDLAWSRMTGTNDLAISLKGVQVITVQNHFSEGYAVETVSFTDGTTYDLAHLTMTTTGTAATDYLSGTSVVNDTINALAGDDYLYGYGGNDTLNGGVGTDNLLGGAGDDIYVFKTGESPIASPDIVYETLNEGMDTIKLTGGILPANVSMWTDSYNLHIRYSPTDEITIQAGYDPITGASAAGSYIEKIAFDNGTMWDLRNGLTMNDTGDAHTIYGSVMNDVIDGKAGDDTINGYTGNDTLTGGTGTDQLYGGVGDDTYVFKAGDSPMTASPDIVTEYLSEGIDTIKLTGGILPSDVRIWTDNDNLYIRYSPADQITIRGHRDGYPYYSNAIADYVEKIVFENGTVWDLRNGLPLTDTDDAHQVYGSKMHDVIDGRGGDDQLNGMDGNDVISGGIGNDYIYGGNGNDVIDGGAGNDTLIGGNDFDRVTYASAAAGVTVNLGLTAAQNTVGAGTDTLSGFEYLIGSAFNDTLTGDASDNFIQGGAGNDTLAGGAGMDTLTYADAASAVTINLALATAQNTLGAGSDTVTGFENLTGSAFNDTLTGDANANIIQGGAGNDSLNGAAGIDTVSYGDATAAVTVNLSLATAQNTVGAGTDTLSGFENIMGSAYNDTLTGDANANILSGGLGNDTMNGAGGVDTANYAASASAVTVNLSTGIATGEGSDALSNIENVAGSAYNDSLTGNSAVNVINGGSGNDVLYGNGGADTLYGGAGADTFILKALTAMAGGTATIADYKPNEGDIIDISNVLSGGYDPVTQSINDFVQLQNSGANTILKVDMDGTGAAQGWTQAATISGATLDLNALIATHHLIVA